MAKRRKEKDEETEDKGFKPPKFDKEAFLKRERRNIKATFIACIFGAVVSLVCTALWIGMGRETDYRWLLVLVLCIASASFIKYIYLRINLDISDFVKKNWFTTYGIYLFTWLLVFIVLVNPPFYDSEDPKVDLAVLPGMQELGGNITFVAKMTDNVGVVKDSLSLEIVDPDDNSITLAPAGFELNDIIVKYVFENSNNLSGDFSYTFTVKDTNDHTTVKTGTFSMMMKLMLIGRM